MNLFAPQFVLLWFPNLDFGDGESGGGGSGGDPVGTILMFESFGFGIAGWEPF